MTDTIINLFPQRQTDISTETPQALLERLSIGCTASKALVILIDERGGVWASHLAMAGMTNAEANLALDISKDLVLTSILGG